MEQNHIAVNTARIENDRQSLDQSIVNIESRMISLSEKVRILNQNWQGSANLAFMQAMSEDFQLMGQLLTEITNYSQALAYAEMEFINCEYEVQARIQYLGV